MKPLDVMLMTSCCARVNILSHFLLWSEAPLANVLSRMGRGGFLSTLECPPLLCLASHAHDLPAFRTCYAMHFFFHVEGAPLSVLLMHPFEPSLSARLRRHDRSDTSPYGGPPLPSNK